MFSLDELTGNRIITGFIRQFSTINKVGFPTKARPQNYVVTPLHILGNNSINYFGRRRSVW